MDTEPVHWACYAEVLKPHGIDLDWETYRRHCVGMADFEMLEFLGARAEPPVAAEILQADYGRKNELFAQRMSVNPKVQTETRELLEELSGALALAIVSSSGRTDIEPVLDLAGLRPFFETTVYGGDVTNFKPHPEPYLLAAQRLNAKRPLVVEDSDAGVQSGLAAGFDVVLVDKPSNTAALVRKRLS